MNEKQSHQEWERLLALGRDQGTLDVEDIEEYCFFQGITPGSKQSFEVLQGLQQADIQVPENLWVLPSENAATRLGLEKCREEMFNTLKLSEQFIVRLRFGIGIPELGLEAICTECAVTPERIRAIQARALRILRALQTKK